MKFLDDLKEPTCFDWFIVTILLAVLTWVRPW